LIGKWHEVFDSEFDTFQFFIWHKTNPAPKIYKNGFLNSCEMIICLWNKGHKWNFSTQNEMHNFFESPICMPPERLRNPKHPAQKPVKLLSHIINIASDPGDIVFDPFMGVGSTGVAAKECGRRFVGCEIDKAYYDAACIRMGGNPS
jgi:site-specific DNA-methyltransferase (adenine-specific)/modification methylase